MRTLTQMPRLPRTKRNERVLRLHSMGLTWQAIVDRLAIEGFGQMKRQNVGRIVKRWGK